MEIKFRVLSHCPHPPAYVKDCLCAIQSEIYRMGMSDRLQTERARVYLDAGFSKFDPSRALDLDSNLR